MAGIASNKKAGDVGLVGADPAEFHPVELDFRFAEKLRLIESPSDQTNGEPIGLGHAVYIICRNRSGGAGHILNDDLRISGNLFWQVTSHQPGQQIAAAPGRSIINDANGLVFVKRTGLSAGIAGSQNPPDGDTAKG